MNFIIYNIRCFIYEYITFCEMGIITLNEKVSMAMQAISVNLTFWTLKRYTIYHYIVPKAENIKAPYKCNWISHWYKYSLYLVKMKSF